MRIIFARHGESQANLLHEISNRGLRHGLTRQGRGQALALAERLRGRAISRIYTSPLLRAIETTVITAGALDLEYEVTGALREYDCGMLEGRSDEAAWQGWQALHDAWALDGRWEQRIEGGESFIDLRERFEPFVMGLVDRYRGTDAEVMCVSHGGVYGMMLPVVLKNVDRALVARHGFDYTACIVAELRPQGLVCVEWNGQPVETLPR